MIRVYDEAGKVIETHEQTGEFKELVSGDVCGTSGEIESRHAVKRDG